MGDLRTFVALTIVSDSMSAIDIARATELTFDTVWNAGEAKAPSRWIERRNGCTLESGGSETLELSEQLAELFSRIGPKSQKIAALQPHAEVLVCCAIYSPDVPELYFDAQAIQRLAALGAALDLDDYPT